MVSFLKKFFETKRKCKMDKKNNPNFKSVRDLGKKKIRAPANSIPDRKTAWPVVKKKEKKISEDRRLNSSVSLLEYYITHTSFHGIKYILDPELYRLEKMIWFICVVVSTFFTAQVIVQITTNYQAVPIVVVIESMNYRVSSLSFPCVTICPRDRVDWKKAMALEKKIIPSNNSQSIKFYRQLMTTLSTLSFAKYNEVYYLKNNSFPELMDLNITDIMYKVVPSCEDLFSSCWWRYYNQNCCEIFHLQKTEFGFCYSFNSAFTENIAHLREKNFLRTSGFGEQSGLKVTIHVGNVTGPPSNSFENLAKVKRSKWKKEKWQAMIRGATIFLNNPESWPASGEAIAPGAAISVKVKCTSGYATQNILNLSPDKIPCRYERFDNDAEYNQKTCISQCKQEHVKKLCACNPHYFPTTETRDCNVKDFICLIKHNEIFTNYQIPGDYNKIEYDEPIMFCDCLPACNFSQYESSMIRTPMRENKNIMLDVHFEAPTSVLYKMDVVVTKLGLLVSLGGIFGLFIGGSIISLLEIIYTFTIGAFGRFYYFMKVKKEKLLK